MLADPALAASATLLFCFNPASAFFSAAYTESLFAGLTMVGLYYQASRPWTSAVSFAAASATRSNGEYCHSLECASSLPWNTHTPDESLASLQLQCLPN